MKRTFGGGEGIRWVGVGWVGSRMGGTPGAYGFDYAHINDSVETKSSASYSLNS